MKLVPVHDPKTGEIQLYDMYIENKWHGSRRTKEQCELYYDQWLNGPYWSRNAS